MKRRSKHKNISDRIFHVELPAAYWYNWVGGHYGKSYKI